MIPTLKKLRCRMLVALTHHIALPALQQLRKAKPFPYSMDSLKAMPAGSLGNDLHCFIESRGLQLLTHYARHDMKHIVLGYDTTEEGELCLQSFMLGNGRMSLPVLATVLFGICTAPELWRKMRLAYELGQQCLPIHDWDWNALLPQPTICIRQSITCHATKQSNA